MKRLFVGLDLPDDIKDILMGLETDLSGARWRPWDNFHLTLRFLGDIDRHTEMDILSALDQISSPKFELALHGAGQFGNKKPHTLWAGVQTNPALMHLAQKVETAIMRAGLPAERRKFTPHVTLAYLKNPDPEKLARFIADHTGFSTAPFLIDRFDLFQSHQGNGPNLYEKLTSFDLTYDTH